MSSEKKETTAEAGNTELVSQTSGAVMVMDDDIDFAADSGAGFENVTDSMKIIPFIRILQDLSPQTKKTKKEYIEGSYPGAFWETASNTFYKGEDGIVIVPISVTPKWIEWVPRDNGGGMVRRWEDNSYKNKPGYVQAEKGSKWITPEGNEIIEYLDIYCLLVEEDGNIKAAVLSTKSTAIQAARSLITMADQVRIVDKNTGRRMRPAMFFSAFRAKLKEQSNEQGTWYGLSFVRETDTTKLEGGNDIYRTAREYQKQILDGQVGVRDEELEESGEAGQQPHNGPTTDTIDAI